MSEAPEPTFLERLKRAREAATPVIADGAAETEYAECQYLMSPVEAEYFCLLVNNAENLAALIEAVGTRHMDHGGYNCPHDGFEGCDCYAKAVAACGICQAVQALNEGPS